MTEIIEHVHFEIRNSGLPISDCGVVLTAARNCATSPSSSST